MLDSVEVVVASEGDVEDPLEDEVQCFIYISGKYLSKHFSESIYMKSLRSII